MLDPSHLIHRPPERAIVTPLQKNLAERIGSRAQNLFLTHQYYCSESAILSLNHGLGGGLSEAQAVGMAAPYSMAMGESGCVCGALSGSVLAIGLLTAGQGACHLRRRSRSLARELHDQFKNQHGSACCRVLTRKVKGDPRRHRQQCAELTGWAASAAARLLLSQFPDLLHQADGTYLNSRQSRLGGLIQRLKRWVNA